MRVLLTVPSLAPEFGGPTGKALALARALRGVGHEAEVVGCGSAGGAEGAVGLPVGLRFHATPVPRALRPLLERLARADLVHVIGYRDPVGTAAVLAARHRRVPYLLEPAGMHRRRLRSRGLKAAFDLGPGALVVRGARVVVATSPLEARELAEDGVEPRRIRVRPNGLVMDGLLPLPSRGSFREAVGVPPDVPLVLSLGRIAAKKGLLHLAEAVAAIPGTWAVVAGPDGRDGTLPALMEARRRLGIEDRMVVRPVGLWGRAKAEALADAECFCLPSATENFGTAAAEAAAVGLPVVVSDQCGAAPWLGPGAQVVPFGDIAALAGAVRRAVQDGEPRALARAAAHRVRQELDWSHLARRQGELYLESMGAAR